MNILKRTAFALLAFLALSLPGITVAQDDSDALTESQVELTIQAMQSYQDEAGFSLEALKARVKNIPRNDSRRLQALDRIEALGKQLDKWLEMSPAEHVSVQEPIGNTPALVSADEEFRLQQKKVQDLMGDANRILLGAVKPDEKLPEGDLVEDFIPQLIRQLFRFAWLAVFVAFVVAGVMLVLAFGDDERLEKAKRISYYTLIGFVFVTLAFAIVKAITQIDFFRFV